MKLSLIYKIIHYKALRFLFSSVVLLFFCFSVSAQEEPPRPLQITPIQNLNFGAIIQGTVGGTVIMDPQGLRTRTGDLILVNMGSSYNPALFDIQAIPGSLINIVFNPGVFPLAGNHGGTLFLRVDKSFPSSPFINTKSSGTQVLIGGTLTVGSSMATPAGYYFGTFTITFAQQ